MIAFQEVRKKARTIGWLLSLVLLAVGVLSTNYTLGVPGSWEHHTEWARAKGLPEPSFQIFVLGAALTAVGGRAFGYLLGEPRRAK